MVTSETGRSGTGIVTGPEPLMIPASVLTPEGQEWACLRGQEQLFGQLKM